MHLVKTGLETNVENADARPWTMPVKLFLGESGWRLFQGSQSLKAHVQVEQARLDPDDVEFERHYEHLDGRLPPVLHLSAWATPISVTSWDGLDGPGHPPHVAEVEAEDGRRIKWTFLPTTATRPRVEASAYIAIDPGKCLNPRTTFPGAFVLVARRGGRRGL